MILDKENMFLDKKAVTGKSASSDVVCFGNGDANVQPYLMVNVDVAVSSSATIALVTSDTEDFTTKETLASFDVATTTKRIESRLPNGCKKYLRLDISADTALTTGTFTAGLALGV